MVPAPLSPLELQCQINLRTLDAYMWTDQAQKLDGFLALQRPLPAGSVMRLPLTRTRDETAEALTQVGNQTLISIGDVQEQPVLGKRAVLCTGTRDADASLAIEQSRDIRGFNSLSRPIGDTLHREIV